MPLPRRDFLDFLFNDGKGIRASQIDKFPVTRYDDGGEPSGDPQDFELFRINRDGKVFPVADSVTTHENDPTITTDNISNSDWDYWNNVHDSEPGSVTNNLGHFYWDTRVHYFFQNQGPGTINHVSWSEAINFIDEMSVAVPDNLQDRTWLGFYNSDQAAADALSRISFRDDRDWIFIREPDSPGLYIITAHDDGSAERIDSYAWGAALVTLHDVIEAANSAPGNLAVVLNDGALEPTIIRVIDGRLAIPLASKSYENRLLYNPVNKRLETCKNNPHVNGEAEGDWSDIPDRNDLSVESDRSQAVLPTTGDFVYDISAGHFYQLVVIQFAGNRWGQSSPRVALSASRTNSDNAVRWLGAHNTDQDVLDSVGELTDDTDYFYLRNREIRILDTSTYVAPTTLIDHFEWVKSAPGETFTEDDRRLLNDLGQLTLPHPDDSWHLRNTYQRADFNPNYHANERIRGLGWSNDADLWMFTSEGRTATLGSRSWTERRTEGNDPILDAILLDDYWIWAEPGAVDIQYDLIVRHLDGVDAQVTKLSPLSQGFIKLFADPNSSSSFCILRRQTAAELHIAFFEFDSSSLGIATESTTAISLTDINTSLGAEYADIADVHENDDYVVEATINGDEIFLILAGITRTRDNAIVNLLVPFRITDETAGLRTIEQQGDVLELPRFTPDLILSSIIPTETQMFLATRHTVYELSPRIEFLPSWADIKDKEEVRPNPLQRIEGTDKETRPMSVSDVDDISGFDSVVDRAPRGVLLNDDHVLAHAGTSRYLNPVRRADLDLSQDDNYHSFIGAARTRRWLYSGGRLTGASTGSRNIYRRSAHDQEDTFKLEGLAQTMDSAIDLITNTRDQQYGFAIDARTKMFALQIRTNHLVAGFIYDDEEVAQTLASADMVELIPTALFHADNDSPHDIDMVSLEDGDVTGLAAGLYIVVADSSSDYFYFYRRINGVSTFWKRVAIPSADPDRNHFGVAFQIVNRQLLAYITNVDTGSTTSWSMRCINVESDDRVEVAEFNTENRVALFPVFSTEESTVFMLVEGVDFSDIIRVWNPRSYLIPGSRIRASVTESGTPSGTTLIDDDDVTNAAVAFSLGEVVEDTALYEFRLRGDDAAEANGYAICSGLQLNSLTEVSSAPTDVVRDEALGLKIIHVGDDVELTSFGHDTLWVWNSDSDGQLYIAHARTSHDFTVTVVKIPLAGLITSQQQGGGALLSTDFITQEQAIAGSDLSVNPLNEAIAWNLFNSGGFDKDKVKEIQIIVGVDNTRFDYLVSIPKIMMDLMGYLSSTPNPDNGLEDIGVVNNDSKIPCAYISTSFGSTNPKESVRFRPILFHLQQRRMNELDSLMIFIRDNTASNDIIGLAATAISAHTFTIRRATIFYEA